MLMEKDMMQEGGCGCGGHGGNMGCKGRCGHGGRHMKIFFVCLALLALTAWLGYKARNEAKQYGFIGVPIERNVITVDGEGKVVGKPDVAAIDLGMTIEKPTVAAAQTENTRVMNLLNAALKEAGVADADVQTTAYQVNPNYDWNNGVQKLRSYSVAQNVHVKIRALDKVGDILGKAGSLGANQIGGINFTIDNPEQLKDEARAKAIENAKQKAMTLSQAAGIKLVRVVSFSESYGGVMPQPVMYDKMAYGMGGAAPAAPSPTVESGSNEINANVSITYEIQ